MKLVSFKVPDEIAEHLETLQSGEDSSISLVAKRILLDAIGKAKRKTTVDEKLEAIANGSTPIGQKLDAVLGELIELKKLCP